MDDISLKIETGKFNYRVAGLIINNDKLLVMKSPKVPYFYLPGGRVKFNETAQDAIMREIYEELKVKAKIIRPLWFNQAFFQEDVDGIRYHEICIYFLLDISEDPCVLYENNFATSEKNKVHYFTWMGFEALKEAYFYPLFLKEKIFALPQILTMIEEKE